MAILHHARLGPPTRRTCLFGVGVVAHMLREVVEVERVVPAFFISGRQITYAVLLLLGEDHHRSRAQA
jgi:hypothetical protein